MIKHTKRADVRTIEGRHQDSVGNSVFYLVQNVIEKGNVKA